MKPLSFPKYWLNPTPTQWFLVGVPFIGIDWRAHRHICAQLRSRSSSVWRLWPEDLLVTAKEVAEIVKDYFLWPTPYYIPDDPCAVLFWDRTTELRLEEASMALTEQFGFPTDDRPEELLEGTFGGLIERLLASGFCPCGYNLTGNQSGICPECGRLCRRAAAPGEA